MAPADELPIHQLLGPDKITAIVAGFYRRVAGDALLRPLYPEQDLGPAEQRLRSFLLYRLGGPPDYLRERGHPRLRIRHAPFVVDRRARDRWMELMMESIDEQQVEAKYREYLERFLGDIATFLINSASV